MKLNLLFIVIYLLTFLAYQIVIVHGNLRLFYKLKESIPVPKLFVVVPITPGR